MDQNTASKIIIGMKLGEAEDTASSLGLKIHHKLNILELGCGLGCLSKVLDKFGHNIISCDNLEYDPPDFEKKYNVAYKKVLKDFGFHRNHFYFEIPLTAENIKKNKEMFNKLSYYHRKKYDLIIWQSCDLYQMPHMEYDETVYLVKNLMRLLTNNGKLILGYSPVEGYYMDKTFESTKSYKWLAKWRTQNHPELGFYRWLIPNGSKNLQETLDWSWLLHCSPQVKYQPYQLDKYFQNRAIKTAKSLGLDQIKSKEILEIGCGLGHLSKHLAKLHSVSSVDDDQFHIDDKNYQMYLKHVNWPRSHFYFKVPYMKFKKLNFESIKSLSTQGKKFDYILWQNSCLLDDKKVTLLCLRSLVENLMQHLKTQGKLIIGFDSRFLQHENLNNYYDFLKPLLIGQFSPMGKITICLTKS